MPNLDIEKPKILSKNLFPVVGIGASAGGLEAFKKLIKAIPEDSGMAYILVQHLHPDHESSLPDILQRITNLPVIEISNNVHVKANNIYVIPSNKMLVATDGILNLSPRPTKGKLNLPIDIFFSSLAEVHQAHAIGVILSGNGADGTVGLKAIKDHGGLTFAQDPGSAAFDGMPQHAIDSDMVDFILAPEKIPAKLMELQQSFVVSSSGDENSAKNIKNEFEVRQILALVKKVIGVDFTFYKQTTIRRRIIRRMALLNLETTKDYLDYLGENKGEPGILFHDLLIPVTSFFRDPTTFDALCKTVFPEMLKDKSAGNPLRIWIAGCSSGQEAYSMAICVLEFLGDNISRFKVQIFATDISEKCIEKARSGTYLKKEMEGISETRVQKFFTKVDGNYQIKKQVRDICVFAVHNLLKDPPFAKIDLISCRNVLIYLEVFLQKKVLAMFHYALNDKAVLLLGKSETTGNCSDLFTLLGKRDKLYTRLSTPGKFTNTTPRRQETSFVEKGPFLKNKEKKIYDFQKSADDVLLLKYSPPGVVVNEQFDIVQFRGLTGEYLEPSPGLASLNVLKMAKETLSFEIRNALHKAKSTREPFIKSGIPISKGKKLVNIEVIPLLNTVDLHYLILFKDEVNGNGLKITGKGKQLKESKGNGADLTAGTSYRLRIEQLEKELAQGREDMSTITEDQESANEELQSSNEELLSGSEELQSLNEELETGKEELQSTNEELITVNQELYERNEALNLSRRFAETTISIIHEPLVVLDENFVIKSANKSFYRTFQLTEDATLGKVLFQLQNSGWEIPGLRKAFEKIRTEEKEVMIETEIAFTFPLIGERVICFNIQAMNKENGRHQILVAFDDITLKKKEEKSLREKADEVSKERQVLHNFFMQTPALLCILKGPDHVFELANPIYLDFIGNREVVGKRLIEVIPELKGQGFVELLNKVYNTGEPYTGRESPVFIESEKGKPEQRFLNFHYQAFKNTQGIIEDILVFAYDVTQQVNTRKQLERNAEMIQNLYMNAPAFICTMQGPKHIYDLVNPSYQKIFGKRKLMGKPLMEALPELKDQGFDKLLDKVYETGETYVGNEILITLGRDEGQLPEQGYFNFSYQPIYNEAKKINGILVFGYEVTELVNNKKIKQESDARFHILTDTMPQKMSTMDATGNLTYLNQQWLNFTHKTFEELQKLGWKSIVHPDDWEINQQTWDHSLKTGEDFELEQRFLSYGGKYCWHLSRRVAQKDEKGKIMGWIGTHTDIDDQKKKEQTKDDFISIASHEMKTPLTTAKAYLQLLELSLDKKDAEATLYANKATRSVIRLNDLINELLDASKIQVGKLNYNITTFNFNDLIDNTVVDIQYSSPIHTIVKTGKVQREVTGDKDRLQQVVINLLNNAIKYTPNPGKILLHVEQRHDEIKISVKDKGIGISKKNLEQIFNKYYRVSDHAIPSQGLGIGLFICYEIIERHHGKLWAESIPEKGSTFYFTLPLTPIQILPLQAKTTQNA